MAAISVTIVTKDDPEALEKCLDSVQDVLLRPEDELLVLDTGSTPENLAANKVAVAAAEGLLVHQPNLTTDFTPFVRQWIPEQLEKFQKHYPDPNLPLDFSAMRAEALKAASNDIVFWIDTDDILVDPQGELRNKVDEFMGPADPKVDAIFLDYKYTFDVDGACTTTLRRERFFFKDRYYWAGRCHETAIPKPDLDPPMRNVAVFGDLEASIVHTDARKADGVSDIRNYVILRREYEETKEALDPRTVFYLANAARGLRRFKEAADLYDEFDALSGSGDDRYAAYYYRGAMYLDPEVNRPLSAVEVFEKCVDLDPSDPRGYFGMARAYAALYRYEQSFHWYKIGCGFGMSDQFLFSYDPTHINYHPHVLAAYVAHELKRPDLARQAAEKAIQARPDHPTSVALRQEVQAAEVGAQLRNAIAAVTQHFTHGGPNATRVIRELCKELKGVPEECEELGWSAGEGPDGRAERPSLAIFCGHTPESWGPKCRDTGIGGSEKMVIMLAPLLQKHGPWNVTVYANVPKAQRGVYEDNVRWCHWSEFDDAIPRDVFVSWRSPEHLLRPVRARKRVLWNHDVQDPGRYTPEVLSLVDHVQLQSEFHRAPWRSCARPRRPTPRFSLWPPTASPRSRASGGPRAATCTSPTWATRSAPTSTRRRCTASSTRSAA
jgi:tetratricopeptide (TPR) repeat protein